MAAAQAARLFIGKPPVSHGLPADIPMRDVGAVSLRQTNASRVIERFRKDGEPLGIAGARLRMSSRLSCVRQAPIFRGLSLGDCTCIASQAQERHLQRRQTLFRQGEPVGLIFLIASGRVKVTQSGPHGEEVILWLKGPGDIVGGLGLTPGTPNQSSAQAIELCHVISWDAVTMQSLSQSFPILQRNTVTMLAESLRDIQERFREMATEKVASRLARTLLRLLESVCCHPGDTVRIRLSREELAQMTGTTLFAVSRLLSEWTQGGVIDARREAVLVSDASRLLELAEESTAA